MPDKPFDIKQGRQASPTSRPIIISNQNVQDPMVLSKRAAAIKPSEPSTPKTNSLPQSNQQQAVALEQSTAIKPKRGRLRLILFVLGGLLFILLLLNVALDAGWLELSVPLLPITNVF